VKVGIDIRSTLKRKTGVGYYTLNLINSLADIDTGTSYHLYSYIRLLDFKRRLPKLPGSNFKHRVDRLGFKPSLKMKDVDIFHTSSYDIPKFGNVKLVTTIHDIIPLVYPEGYPKEVLRGLEEKVKRVLSESDLIIVDSKSTGKDLKAKFSAPEDKVRVVYPGRDESLKAMEGKDDAKEYIRKNYHIDKPFILFTGTIEKRKNVKGLMEAFFALKKSGKIPHQLVIVGMTGWGAEPALKLLESSPFKDEVEMIGYIERKDMVMFYNSADVFVYPSFYEGFGFPILEAFSSGVPVITSKTTSCGELAGDSALTIDPDDDGALRDAIRRILSDNELKANLVRRGFERVQSFSWKNTAKQFSNIFSELQ